MQFLLLFGCLALSLAEKLIFTQLHWRHGLRTTVHPYPNDPYNETFYGVPGGELVTKGMEQHFLRGKQLRQRYVEDLELVSAKYSRYETYVRSCNMPRCSASALSNFAAFYAGSPTHPADLEGWPSQWTPIPIHTVPYDEDYVLESYEICARYTQLQYERMDTRAFQDFVAAQWRLFHAIHLNAGYPTDDHTFPTLWRLQQILKVEKDLNLTFPDWITDEFYQNLEDAVYQGADFMLGGAGFGLTMNPELVSLASGFILNEWIENLQAAVNGTSTIKYYVYSGHDAMLSTILIGLGMKQELIGPFNPDYASTLACELWEKDGRYFVKFVYSDNTYSDFVPFTSRLPGCTSDLCPLDTVISILSKYAITDTSLCNAR